MIKEDEITQVAKVFGSTVETIRKDHAIRHVLHCLSKIVNKPEEKIVVFYGGTALNRTYFKDFRLSEDIDLIVESYPQWIETMKAELLTLISYEYNDAMWTSERERTQDGVWTGFLACTQGVEVQIQCVKPRARWEYYLPHLSAASVELRYSDLPTSVEFLVPNSDAFAARKYVPGLTVKRHVILPTSVNYQRKGI